MSDIPAPLILYGPEISVFTRIIQSVATQADITWQLIPTGAGTKEMGAHHPFLRAPVAYIDGHKLYESLAIATYIDSTYNAAGLQPRAPLAQARALQWISVAHHYIFPLFEERLILPRLVAPLMGRVADETLISEALPVIAYHAQIIDAAVTDQIFLAGDMFSLADIFMFAIIDATLQTSEGTQIITQLAHLSDWWRRCKTQDCLSRTAWPSIGAVKPA